MDKNKKKQKHMENAIDKQNLAAWADIERLEPVSRVPIPSEDQVRNAKEWVDKNQL